MSEIKHPALNKEADRAQPDTSSDRYLAWSSQAPGEADTRYAPIVDKRDRYVYPLMMSGFILTMATGIGVFMLYSGQIKAGIKEYGLVCGPRATAELDGFVQQVVEGFCEGVNDGSPDSAAFNMLAPLEEQSLQGVS